MLEFLNNLIPNIMSKPDVLLRSLVETLTMVGISGIISFFIGLVIGTLLVATRAGGVMERRRFHAVLSKLIDLLRSIPFIILLTALMPLSRAVMGTAIGVKGALIGLVFGTVPFFSRQVESALSEVPDGLVEAAASMGCSPREILLQVYLRESVPGIARGFTITLISLISFTAMAGTIGAGGLGDFALRYGHSYNQHDVTWVTILVILGLVSIIQWIGGFIAKKSTH